MTTSAFNTDEDRLTGRKVLALLSRLRDLDNDMPVQQTVVLLWVALNEGRTQRELRDQLVMPSSTASRSLAALSKVHRLGKPGLGLIDFFEDPEDRRAKQLFLTAKGKATIDRMLRDLD